MSLHLRQHIELQQFSSGIDQQLQPIPMSCARANSVSHDQPASTHHSTSTSTPNPPLPQQHNRRNMSSERSPLLRGHLDGASEAPENDRSSKFSGTARWLRLILVAALVALVVAFIAVIAIHPPGDQPAPVKEKEVCTSAGCVLASALLLRSLSPRHEEIDPCEDFQSFVCEGWEAEHEMRQDQSRTGTLQVMNDANQLILKHILESPAPAQVSDFWTASSPDQEIFNKLHDGYTACMNETRLQALGSKPLLEVLFKLDKLYPREKPNTKVDTSLTDAVGYLMEIGVPGPIALAVTADDKDPDSNVVILGPEDSFGLPTKQYYNNTEVVTAYKETIGTVLEALLKEANEIDFSASSGVETPHFLSKDLVDDIVSLESRMAAASPDVEDLEDITKTYNPRTLEQADKYNKEISVRRLIRSFVGKKRPSKIIVQSPEYLQFLSKILAAEKRETIQAYLAWKVVQEHGTLIQSEAVRPLYRFNNKLQGQDADVKPERWKTCLSAMNTDLPWILSRLYIERAFSKEAKDLGDQIIYDIKDAFSNTLSNSGWMSEDVRDLAIDKVSLIRQKIGYPTKSPDVTSPAKLQKFYKDVKIYVDTYFANRLSSKKDEFEKIWEQLGKPVDKNVWGMSASTVNAYYNPPGNEIVFPAGIMQAPVFYDPSHPKYLSYGAFGAVAGHELSHAFDSSGSNYDPNGNYTDWWDESTINAFKKKTECFVEQYGNFTIPTKDGPLHINGKLTLGENIADAGGLAAAYQSWEYRDSQKPDLLLPGLQKFTKEQLFFIAYGVTWCGKAREEAAIRLIYSDPHSPPKYRILGTTANSGEFREAFNCPVKEPTCKLW